MEVLPFLPQIGKLLADPVQTIGGRGMQASYSCGLRLPYFRTKERGQFFFQASSNHCQLGHEAYEWRALRLVRPKASFMAGFAGVSMSFTGLLAAVAYHVSFEYFLAVLILFPCHRV
ncbi:predicted protein [Methanosarcina acetivorans C2A]|uniref:Uncharacterized protein n=1 Tax=Methanosarcina acetivorans (strain ATCC 35395 / DSM 2834 / JCM 12185 / C2A) TaxID=188937 RepID=Q8TN06_METAC|nr:predicted protein [Methanosarcina acetivorans C2A]